MWLPPKYRPFGVASRDTQIIFSFWLTFYWCNELCGLGEPGKKYRREE
jgi:hypothetical protein